jgi:superfamily II DNA or RNA helicase
VSDIHVRKLNEAYLKIDCEDKGILKEISEFFTFKVPNAQFTPAYKNKIWDGFIRLFNLNTRELYCGLYHHLLAFAAAEGREYTVHTDQSIFKNQNVDIEQYLNNMIVSSRGEMIKHHDEQVMGVSHAINQGRAVLKSPTASGKSLMIYSIVKWYLENYDKKVVIIVPTTSLVNQMFTDFGDYSEFDDSFNNVDLCHMIYSGKDKDSEKRVYISTWQSIYKLGKEYFEQFGCVIGDEAHQFKAKSLTEIMTKLIYAEYRFGLTGTLDGTQTHRLVLEGLFGPVKEITTTKNLIDQGKLAKLNITALKLNYGDEERKLVTKMKYHDEVDFVVRYEPRNKFIANLALDQKGNTLVLFQFVEKHGKPLYNIIKEKADKDRKIFYVSGETDAESREQIRSLTEKEKNAIIVASYGCFSTGINIRNINRIIFSSPSKSQIRILQSIGRGLRKSDDGSDTILYDIMDDLSWKKTENYCLKHGGERMKIYIKEQFPFKLYEVSIC